MKIGIRHDVNDVNLNDGYTSTSSLINEWYPSTISQATPLDQCF
jgi:hypothetical protein